MRVISGTRRGKKLFSPAGDATRPTLDSVKESIFNLIQFDVADSYCLDLFGGSGQLAIETVSRGASGAVVCEISRDAAEVIKKNIKACGFTDNISLFTTDALAYIASYRGRPFDIVFSDPPYGSGLCEKSLETLSKSPAALSSSALVVCETAADAKLGETYGPLTLIKERKYGHVRIWIYRREEP